MDGAIAARVHTATVGGEGADLLTALLRPAGATPIVEPTRWNVVDVSRRSKVELGVISVDDDAVRRAFQLDMPRRILNGGTSDDGMYRVSTHDRVACGDLMPPVAPAGVTTARSRATRLVDRRTS